MNKLAQTMILLLLKWLFYFVGAVAVLAAGLSAYLAWFQPPFYFPRPTGRYAVGVTNYYWVDVTRKEIDGNDPKHPNRELMIKIWYPASPSLSATPGTAQGLLLKKSTIIYAPERLHFFQRRLSFFGRLIGLSRPIYCYGQPNAVLATAKPRYPVTIFSHGFGTSSDSNTTHCEELASHGYVVVGINHTYDSSVTQFSDGRIADGVKSIQKRMRKNTRLKWLDQEIEVWIADTHFVLDQLEQLANDKKSIFYQHLDQGHIGMFGHSFGGATAVHICQRDPRVKAGVDLDGSLFGPDVTKNFNKPFMAMLSENDVKLYERPWTRDDWKKVGICSLDEERKEKAAYLPALKRLAQSADHDAYIFVINGTKHMDFSDIAILKYASPIGQFLTKLGFTGCEQEKAIDGFRATKIVNAYLINFFDKYLKGQPSPLLDGTSKPYAEIKTKQWTN